MGLIFPLQRDGSGSEKLKSFLHGQAGLFWLGFGGIAAIRSAIFSFFNFLFSFHHHVQD